MKSFLVACVATLVIAIGSVFVLEKFQKNAEIGYTSTTGVRI